MKYMLLIYDEEQAWAKLSDTDHGLRLIEAAGASAKLDRYYLFHAARADLLRRLNRLPEAATAYSRAVALTTNPVEQRYIRRRLSEVTTKRQECEM